MKRDNVYKFMLNAIFILLSFLCVAPLTLMLLDSFKLGSELAANSWGLPVRPTMDNYVRLLNYNAGTMIKSYMNGVFISTSYTLLTIMVSSLAAYSFSKYTFKGKKTLFFLLLSTMMVPTEIALPPLYIMFSKMHWLNTFQVQIIPGIASVFVMFMLKQYIDGLPTSLIESARIDGAGHLMVFSRIMLPLASPAIGAMTILTFLGKWNDYLWPIIMLTKPKYMPIMVLLPTLSDRNNIFTVPWELVLTGCTIVTLPLIGVFLVFQDKFMSSVTMGAVKE